MIRYILFIASFFISKNLTAQCSSPCCCFSTFNATITLDEDICLPTGTPSVIRTITVNATGGTAPYTYFWSIDPVQPDPGNVNSDSFTLTETTTFTVTVIDDDDCEFEVISVVTISLEPVATLTDTEYIACRNCGVTATINLTSFQTPGEVGQWFEGDQMAGCNSPTDPVGSPSSVILTEPFTQFTWGVAGTGVCAGTNDCIVLDAYFNINANLADLILVGDVCEDATVSVFVQTTGNLPCFTDYLDFNATAGIVNTVEFDPLGLGETDILDGSGNVIGLLIPTGGLQGVSTAVDATLDGSTLGEQCTLETPSITIDGTTCCVCEIPVLDSDDIPWPGASNQRWIQDIVVQECGGAFTSLWTGGAAGTGEYIPILTNGCPYSAVGLTTAITLADAVADAQDEADLEGINITLNLSGTEITVIADCGEIIDISFGWRSRELSVSPTCSILNTNGGDYIVTDSGCCD